MKKLFLLTIFLLSGIWSFAQCPSAQNPVIWNETETTLTVKWDNSLPVAGVLVNGILYKDGNSGLYTWTSLGAIVMQKCVIATNCNCAYNAGQGLEITVRSFCDWPNTALYVDRVIAYQLNYPVDCPKKKGKKK